MPPQITVGTVSYLNAVPLVHGLEEFPGVSLIRAVPSRLLDLLVDGRADLALCPVVDYQLAPVDLTVIPSGAIGSRDETLTVRLFGRLPFDRTRTLWVDGDSHTSVALAEVVLARRFGVRPEVTRLPPGADPRHPEGSIAHMLLIGDKVVTRAPRAGSFPHQLDLGRAWRELTGLPFVFATWMTRRPDRLGDLPDRLVRIRREALERVDEHLGVWAGRHGWPPAAAREYLVDRLDYEMGPEQRAAIERFFSECRDLGLLRSIRPLRVSGR